MNQAYLGFVIALRNALRFLFSQENHLKEAIRVFFHYINKFNLREVVLKLHNYRNTLDPQEIFKQYMMSDNNLN